MDSRLRGNDSGRPASAGRFLSKWQNESMTRRRRAAEEIAFRPVDNARLAALCGPLDANLRQIETALDVSIARRGERFAIEGAREKAARAAQALKRFYEEASHDLSIEDI